MRIPIHLATTIIILATGMACLSPGHRDQSISEASSQTGTQVLPEATLSLEDGLKTLAKTTSNVTQLLRFPFDSLSTSLGWATVYPNSGCSIYQSGIQNYCYTFTGDSDSYVSIPDNATIDLGTSDFTLGCWVKTSSTKTFNTILDKRDATTGVGYHFLLYSGHPVLQMATASGYGNLWGGSSSAVFNDGKWHYLAASVDRDSSTGAKLYADGVLIETLDPTPYAESLANTAPLLVAKHKSNTSGYFEGSLDDLRILQGAATQEEVRSLSGVTSIEGGECLSGTWSSEYKSMNLTNRNARYYTFQITTTTTVRIATEGTVANSLFLLSGTPIQGTPVATTATSGRKTSSTMVIELEAGTYVIEAATYDANATGTFTLSLGYFWEGRLNDEIEAKWEFDETQYAAMVTAFADGATKYGYTVNVRWSGVPRKYVDAYYDVPWNRILKPAHHALRYRCLYSNTSGLSANPTRAQLEAATWGTLEWRKVQYKSTPAIAKPIWFRAETTQEDVTSTTHAEAIIHGTASPNVIKPVIQADHPSLNLSVLFSCTAVVDYRYKIELLKDSEVVYEVSLDRMEVDGVDAMQCELELIRTSRSLSDVWETYRLANLIQAEFGLEPATQSKGEY